jgi:hypothetical protein
MLDAALLDGARRFSCELCSMCGLQAPRSWCKVELGLYRGTAPGNGPLFSLSPTVDQFADVLTGLQAAVACLLTSLRPLTRNPALAPFVHMAECVVLHIPLAPSTQSQFYTFAHFVSDAVKRALLLSSNATTALGAARADGLPLSEHWAPFLDEHKAQIGKLRVASM